MQQSLWRCIFFWFVCKSVSKWLRCHMTNIAAPRVLWPHSAQCFPGPGRPATPWLPSNCVSSIRLWGTFRSARCPSIALPCCDSMTTRCCCLCWWPRWEILWIFANWYIYPESSTLLSFYSLCLKRRLLWGCPLKKKVTNPGTGLNPSVQGWHCSNAVSHSLRWWTILLSQQ